MPWPGSTIRHWKFLKIKQVIFRKENGVSVDSLRSERGFITTHDFSGDLAAFRRGPASTFYLNNERFAHEIDN
jgi:hypothetical protein